MRIRPLLLFSSLLASALITAAPAARVVRTLTAADIRYVGAIRMPQSGTDTTFSYGGIAGRVVGGKTHFFVYGNHRDGDRVYEIEDPGAGYATDYKVAPRATLVTAWGDIFHGKRISYNAATGAAIQLPYAYPDALSWNEANQLLYWTYNDSYNVTGRQDWALGASKLLDPTTAQSAAYGPWRTKSIDGDGVARYGPWRCLYLFTHPDGTMMCGSSPQSGNVSAPWGPDAYGGAPWPTIATPSNVDVALPHRYLEYYFMGNPQSANYVDNDGRVHGALRAFRRTSQLSLWEGVAGTLQLRANQALNGGVSSWSEQDGTGGAVWLELTNTRAVIFAATLAGAVSQDPADCVNASHEWYSTALNDHKCTHGCVDPVGVTGPVSTASFPAFFLFNPDDLNAVKAGTKLDYSVDPTAMIDLERTYGLKTADIRTIGVGKTAGGFYFDPVRKYLFAASLQADDSRVGPQFLESLIHVFAINDGDPVTPLPPVVTPPPTPTPAPPAAGQSANGTRVTRDAAQLVDASGGIWTLNGQTVQLNGQPAAGGQGSILLWYSGTVYAFGTDSNWYRYSAGNWIGIGTTAPDASSPPPTPLPVPTLSVSVVAGTCIYTVVDSPPDALGGWKVQFKRGAGTSVGNAATTPPYTRSTTLLPGNYQFFATWTKSGQATITRPLTSTAISVGGCK